MRSVHRCQWLRSVEAKKWDSAREIDGQWTTRAVGIVDVPEWSSSFRRQLILGDSLSFSNTCRDRRAVKRQSLRDCLDRHNAVAYSRLVLSDWVVQTSWAEVVRRSAWDCPLDRPDGKWCHWSTSLFAERSTATSKSPRMIFFLFHSRRNEEANRKRKKTVWLIELHSVSKSQISRNPYKDGSDFTVH